MMRFSCTPGQSTRVAQGGSTCLFTAIEPPPTPNLPAAPVLTHPPPPPLPCPLLSRRYPPRPPCPLSSNQRKSDLRRYAADGLPANLKRSAWPFRRPHFPTPLPNNEDKYNLGGNRFSTKGSTKGGLFPPRETTSPFTALPARSSARRCPPRPPVPPAFWPRRPPAWNPRSTLCCQATSSSRGSSTHACGDRESYRPMSSGRGRLRLGR